MALARKSVRQFYTPEAGIPECDELCRLVLLVTACGGLLTNIPSLQRFTTTVPTWKISYFNQGV